MVGIRAAHECSVTAKIPGATAGPSSSANEPCGGFLPRAVPSSFFCPPCNTNLKDRQVLDSDLERGDLEHGQEPRWGRSGRMPLIGIM